MILNPITLQTTSFAYKSTPFKSTSFSLVCVYKELKPTGERMDDFDKGYFTGILISYVGVILGAIMALISI